MAISFSDALGVHEQTLQMRAKRSEVLATNIANADTPGYKARDFDFSGMLRRSMEGGELSMETSHAGHLGGASDMQEPELLYRVPQQPSADGNTVDAQQENAAFARNALEHQASFLFLSGNFSGLTKALKGE